VFTFVDAAVELGVEADMTCAEVISLGLKKIMVSTTEEKLLLVRYKFPPVEKNLRVDDWEVLSSTRTISSYSFGEDYSLLCCSEEEWEPLENGDVAPVRSWFNILIDWNRVKEKTLKFKLRSGIPGWARGSVWALLLGSYTHKQENRDLYGSLVSEAPDDAALGLSERWESDRKVIFRDVFRTYPTHPYFATEHKDGQLALEHVLVAWHSMEPSVGYCQGMNFIAAVFLLHMDEETAFWCMYSLL
jgi:hypothetical protein